MARLTKIRIEDHEATVPDSYTKTQTDNLLNDKQDTLVAGDNITINGNVISASGGGGYQTLSQRVETFWNAAGYTVQPYDHAEVTIENGTVPTGCVLSGLRSVGSGNNHLVLSRVTPNHTYVRNPTNTAITVAANTNYTDRVYLKLE